MHAMDYRTAGRLGLIAALSLLQSCATIQEGLQPPAISLANVALADVSLTRQRFVLDFDVSNPNPVPLPISAINYAVRLAGQSFAEGATAESFTVPASGDGEFQLAIDTNLIESARTLSEIVLRGGQREIDYDLSGDVKVDIPFTRPLPFRQSGKVQLQR